MYNYNPRLQEIFDTTKVVRKPISGIVSDYHELPYTLISPDDENGLKTIQVDGKIKVSPKFVISPSMLGESFSDVFDADTFDSTISGRLFSFAYGRKKNLKVESEYFRIKSIDEKPDVHIDRVHDEMMMQENVRTGLIFSPQFKYYPVSLDRFVNEIVDREFRV